MDQKYFFTVSKYKPKPQLNVLKNVGNVYDHWAQGPLATSAIADVGDRPPDELDALAVGLRKALSTGVLRGMYVVGDFKPALVKHCEHFHLGGPGTYGYTTRWTELNKDAVRRVLPEIDN